MLIHQEAIINADPQAVYDVLTDGQKFAAATNMPAQLSDREGEGEGETFTLFDGRVEGRQIELVPGQRIVQGWRFGATHPSVWDAGVYSVVRFTLIGQEQVAWRCVDGPHDWIETRITFATMPRPDGGTTLMFSHEDWQQETEFMNGCSTNWASYLMSLKSGAEDHGFNAYAGGEIGRWD